MASETGQWCVLAAGIATVGTLFTAGIGPLSTGAGVVALVVLAGSWIADSGSLANLTGAALFAEVLLAGVQGASTTTVLAAGVGTVLAWTFAHSALELRDDLGEARSRRLELSHTAGTTALVAGAAIVAAVLFRASSFELPPLALAALVLAGVALTAALRR
ncbi:DUF7519 family protein [Haloarcula sp. GH36]|uniref:DUF7519 family protein n=1 Tax=Haloarcula montana TaxID=3111776 RepID=UPI002D790EA2|nr:hypothetical protein [Haloarcula sp. GH36]